MGKVVLDLIGGIGSIVLLIAGVAIADKVREKLAKRHTPYWYEKEAKK